MIENIIKAWPIFLAVGLSLIGYGTLQGEVKNSKEQVQKIEEQNLDQEKRLSQVEEAVKQLPEMRQDIKEILKRLK